MEPASCNFCKDQRRNNIFSTSQYRGASCFTFQSHPFLTTPRFKSPLESPTLQAFSCLQTFAPAGPFVPGLSTLQLLPFHHPGLLTIWVMSITTPFIKAHHSTLFGPSCDLAQSVMINLHNCSLSVSLEALRRSCPFLLEKLKRNWLRWLRLTPM